MKSKRNVLLAAFAFLMLLQGTLQRVSLFPQWSRDFSPQVQGIASGLSPDQMLIALAGFREMVAGILWVRADSFFDTGNYDAILPMIRIVTWLDPQQIDVYATGMWHIGYNFTDEQNRSDRRYLPAALALGAEGARRNPQTYEMFFESGWMWYHKIDDLPENSVRWMQQAIERKDMLAARRNILAQAFLRNGEPEKAVDLYYRLMEEANVAMQDPEAFGARNQRDTVERNLDTLLVRMSQRGWFASKGGYFDQGNYDTKPPFDVGFSARVTVEAPRVIRFEGTWNVLPVGTRVRVVLRDEKFEHAIPGGVLWNHTEDVALDPPREQTYMQDQLFVRNRRFGRTVDMSRDLTMYPLNQERYVVEFYYNPRSAPPHMQDKFGFNGEGFTDSNFLNTEIRPGSRVMYTTLALTRDQILRQGEWRDRVPIVQTKNYVAPNRQVGNEPEIIKIPGLRAQ